MTNTLQVTRQDQETVRNILTKHGVAKGSKVKIVPTGSTFAKAFDVLVNGELFARYNGVNTLNNGREEYTYSLA